MSVCRFFLSFIMRSKALIFISSLSSLPAFFISLLYSPNNPFSLSVSFRASIIFPTIAPSAISIAIGAMLASAVPIVLNAVTAVMPKFFITPPPLRYAVLIDTALLSISVCCFLVKFLPANSSAHAAFLADIVTRVCAAIADA